MAISGKCWRCGRSIIHSASDADPRCDDCNGVNEAKAAEKARWDNLTVDEKLNELKERLDNLPKESIWNRPIG